MHMETPASPPFRSKAVAAWLALLRGAFGLHRIYLHGTRDLLAWLHPLPTAAGLLGVERMRTFGQDDRLAWVLLPVLGLMIAQAAACAIWYALTPDERWDARHHGGHRASRTGWAAVLAAVLGLLVGGGVLMGTITYGIQKLFEWQLAPPAAASGAKDEVRSRHQAQRGPEVVPLERLVHVEHREGHEDRQRDDLLRDLQLRQRVAAGVPDAVGRHLQQVLEQRDAPAQQRGHEPGLVGQVLQVAVPGEGHEHVAQHEQPEGLHGQGQSAEG
jgi:hypothetical protein